MYLKLISVAVVAAVFGAASAEAQSVARVGGPANLPPAGFEGQQWVDSRGCVFLKAGYGGQVNWVPRVGRDRRAMCGYPPTGTTRAAIEVATEAEMAAPAAVADGALYSAEPAAGAEAVGAVYSATGRKAAVADGAEYSAEPAAGADAVGAV